MILVLVSAPFKHVSQRQRAFTILAQRTSASHDEKPQFTERTPECRHGSNAVDFNVCEIDCIERTIQINNIGGHVKVSKTLAPILDGLFVSFLAGWFETLSISGTVECTCFHRNCFVCSISLYCGVSDLRNGCVAW
jgi:hypothetical protein